MKYILGVDGGASKTNIRITDYNGLVLSDITAGPVNYKSVGLKRAKAEIIKGIVKTIEDSRMKERVFFESSCFGIAGLDSQEDLQKYREILDDKLIKNYFNFNNCILCNDSKIEFAAGSNKEFGIVINCGTGCVCYGIDKKGEEAISNGWDYILGDEGSGYSIGLNGLKSVMKAYDGRGEYTSLRERVFEHLKIKNELELYKWVYKNIPLKDRIAKFSRMVFECAKTGDEVCLNILKSEAWEAAISVIAVMKKLYLQDKRFDLVMAGSVFDPIYSEEFKKTVIKENVKINFIKLKEKPVSGAIKIAIKNLKLTKNAGNVPSPPVL